jgi:hypothetical protein
VTDYVHVKEATVSRSKSTRIQQVDDLLVFLLTQQVIDGFHYFGPGPGAHIKRQMKGKFQDSLGSAPESHLGDYSVLFLQGHIFHEQARHALPFPMGKVWIVPDFWNIRGECKDPLALFGPEDFLIILLLLFIFLLCCMELPLVERRIDCSTNSKVFRIPIERKRTAPKEKDRATKAKKRQTS